MPFAEIGFGEAAVGRVRVGLDKPVTPGLAVLCVLLGVALVGAGCAAVLPPAAADSELSIADVTVTEGDTGTGNAVFRVTLTPAAYLEVQVSWATADRTATAGSDYGAARGRLTFRARRRGRRAGRHG